MVRPLVSYDDLASSQETNKGSVQPALRQKPSKKRKRSAQTFQPHWDDSPQPRQGNITYDQVRKSSVTIDANDAEKEDGEAVGDEESRELTHEEIWDDSALIDAWNAAMAEYKAYHDGTEDWKKEPVVKSPLWYNVPVVSSSTSEQQNIDHLPTLSRTEPVSSESNPTDIDIADAEEDSQPSDFNTFVPTHDPSLHRVSSDRVVGGWKPAHGPASASHFPDQLVTQDEAFNRALEAMYWCGYWTAAYHYAVGSKPPDVSNGTDNPLHEDVSQEGDDTTDV